MRNIKIAIAIDLAFTIAVIRYTNANFKAAVPIVAVYLFTKYYLF